MCHFAPVVLYLWCHPPAPWEVLPSEEDALTIPTFKSGLTASTGLMRLFLLSHFFVGQPFSFISLLGNIEGSTFLSTVPKLPCPRALVGWDMTGTEAKWISPLSFPFILTEPQGPGSWGAVAKTNPSCSGVNQEPRNLDVLFWFGFRARQLLFLMSSKKMSQRKESDYTWIKGTFLKALAQREGEDVVWFSVWFS